MTQEFGKVPLRLRAKVGQIEGVEGAEAHLKGKWVFTVWVCDLEGGSSEEIGTYGPCETQADAEKACRIKVMEMSELVSKKFSGQPSGFAYDLNQGGRLRSASDIIEGA